jgi:hypothetical protein
MPFLPPSIPIRLVSPCGGLPSGNRYLGSHVRQRSEPGSMTTIGWTRAPLSKSSCALDMIGEGFWKSTPLERMQIYCFPLPTKINKFPKTCMKPQGVCFSQGLLQHRGGNICWCICHQLRPLCVGGFHRPAGRPWKRSFRRSSLANIKRSPSGVLSLVMRLKTGYALK